MGSFGPRQTRVIFVARVDPMFASPLATGSLDFARPDGLAHDKLRREFLQHSFIDPNSGIEIFEWEILIG